MGSEALPVVENVPVETAWRRLEDNSGSVLIDVRTRSEWAFVGLPDLSALGRQPVLVEWSSFPDGQPNGVFVEELSERLAVLGATKDAELFFICRSGVRSQHAAQAMLARGYTRCFNVAEGFEGPLDDSRHRGVKGGWKSRGLPWVQS